MTNTIDIKQFLGLCQDPYGTVNLKPGEAAAMRNFKITEGYHLQLRPGTKTVLDLAQSSGQTPGGANPPTPVRGMFYGQVGDAMCLLAAQGGHVWRLDAMGGTAEDLGRLADGETTFFAFGGKVYLLNGQDYMVWDGTGEIQAVAGYVPLIATEAPPAGGGTPLEPVNLLTGTKRQRFSPDGVATTFQLAERRLESVDFVTSLDGGDLPGYTVDEFHGRVQFASPPAAGVDTIEIQWTKGTGERDRVSAMRYAECFNGPSDTRVFLYGDGTSSTFYSGLTEQGMPTAEYFPALNVLSIDRQNTPVTGLIRHGTRMLAFKPDGAFAVEYDTLPLADGSVAPAFYVTTLNREVGNEAPGQVRLLLNWPYTLRAGSLYRWVMVDSVRDERSAQRVSGRVEASLGTFSPNATVAFDDGQKEEYYLFHGAECLIYHYGLDVWYRYEGLSVTAAQRAGANLFFGTADGRILHVSRQSRNDDGAPIDALWESGSMDFDAGERRVHLLPLTVAMQPESGARAELTLRSNRRGVYRTRRIAYSYLTFFHMNFAHFSFRVNQRPQKQRLYIPVRRGVYDQLIVKSNSASATATILEILLSAREGHKT